MRIDAGKWAVGEGNEGQGEGRQWRLSPEAETPRFLGVGECLWSSRYAHMFLLSVPLSLLRARAREHTLPERRKRDDEKSSNLLLLWIVSLPPDRRPPF